MKKLLVFLCVLFFVPLHSQLNYFNRVLDRYEKKKAVKYSVNYYMTTLDGQEIKYHSICLAERKPEDTLVGAKVYFDSVVNCRNTAEQYYDGHLIYVANPQTHELTCYDASKINQVFPLESLAAEVINTPFFECSNIRKMIADPQNHVTTFDTIYKTIKFAALRIKLPDTNEATNSTLTFFINRRTGNFEIKTFLAKQGSRTQINKWEIWNYKFNGNPMKMVDSWFSEYRKTYKQTYYVTK